MQRRKTLPRQALLAETGSVGGDSVVARGSLVSRRPHNGRGPRTHRRGSTARMDSATGKVGKVSRVAEALPHSEGAGYKRPGREIPACPRDRRMGL